MNLKEADLQAKLAQTQQSSRLEGFKSNQLMEAKFYNLDESLEYVEA